MIFKERLKKKLGIMEVRVVHEAAGSGISMAHLLHTMHALQAVIGMLVHCAYF